VCRDLVPVCDDDRRIDHRLWYECRRRGDRCWARTLGVGAGGVGLEMMMVAGMIRSGMVTRSTRGIGVAQHDGELTVDRHQHEARGDKRAQAEHREHPGRGPM
jgi:hypothetical protein